MMRSMGRNSAPQPAFRRPVRPPHRNLTIISFDMSEEGAGAAFPRHVGELVDRRDHECRQAAIDFLVDDDDRQAVGGKLTIGAVAMNVEPLWSRRGRAKPEAVLLQARSRTKGRI